MTNEELNKLLNCEEMKIILKDIAVNNDFRMCLNKDVIKTYRYFFADVITLSFVVDIQPHDLQNIYHSREDFLTEKIKSILNIQNIGDNIEKIENYFNKILGNKQIIFHGTTSTMEKFFSGNNDKNYVVIKPCLAINNIYRQHEIYCAFQGGISDYNNNNFWVTTSPSSACFYSLQSPEYFARFASRSDYYKQDIYKYDRIAYYRKDYRACLRNVKKEIREFKFNSREKNVILKNFKIMWNNIVFTDLLI